MKHAVQFGAGNIGRGFLGQLFFETGYHTTFIDVADAVVDGLNTRHEYPLEIVGEDSRELTIGNVSAVNARDVSAVAECLADADIAATAVGVNVLPRIAPLIAAGLARRFEQPDAAPLNIIICENLIGGEDFMREEVRRHLDASFHEPLEEKTGFVEASIGRMVPVMSEEQRARDPLLVAVEPYCELPVDRKGFRGDIPPLKNMHPHDNFDAYVERKLFVHNAGHATTGYLGHLRGHTFIWEAIADPVVRERADAAMDETRDGLVRKHGLDRSALDEHWEDLKKRFANKALGDQVARVCKDPIRKLGPNDRLIGAARMCEEQGIEPRAVAFAAAAAILYHNPEDSVSCSLQEMREQRGLPAVLADVCQIPTDSPLNGLITQSLQRLRDEGWV